MYLRQSWYDPRLRFDPDDVNTESIKLEGGIWNKIWVPDTFFRNEKKASYHDVTVSNRMMKLTHQGKLWYVTK